MSRKSAGDYHNQCNTFWRNSFMPNFYDDFWKMGSGSLDGSLFTTTDKIGLWKTGLETIGNSSIDIKEESNRFVMSIPVPGFSKDEIEVELFENMLSIGAVKKENKGKYMKKSLAYSYSLGTDIDADNITSECENGLLIIQLPKIKNFEPKPKKIEVK